MLRLDDTFRVSLASAAEKYHARLMEGVSLAWPYLEARGIGEQIAVSYQIGVVDGSLPEHEMYRGMLCIPYRTKLGGVVSLKFRRAHDCTADCDHAKYISPYPTRLFNTPALDRADETGYVFITEGEFDAILLDYSGFPALGIPGVDAWTAHPEWVSVLAGYSRVFLPQDQDDPGRRLAETIRRALNPGVAVPAYPPEGGRDVNDGWLRAGEDRFRAHYAQLVQGGR